MENKIIIIGLPRNGSNFISKAFRENGIDVYHEDVGKDGISSWVLASKGDVVYLGPTYHQVLKKYDYQVKLYHQIREPISTISSITTISKPSWLYIEKYVNLDSANSLLHKSMIFWLEWNKRCEDMTDNWYQLDNYQTYFNLKKDLKNKNINSRKHKNYELENLYKEDKKLTDEIIKYSEKYGYKLK